MKWIAAVILFSVMILFHEYGHFIVAKLNGVAVEEFSMGFGPRLLSTEHKGTRYSLKLLPFGGSCEMKGMLEAEAEGERVDEDSFNAKPVWQRMAIIFAGPFFNFIMAFVASVVVISVLGYDPSTVTYIEENASALQEGDIVTSINGKHMEIGRDVDSYFTFHALSEGDILTVEYLRNGEKGTASFPVNAEHRFMMGISYYADDTEAQLTQITANSPAYEAGLEAGDVIVAVNGEEISSGAELNQYIDEHPLTGEALHLTVERHSRMHEIDLIPEMTVYVTPGFGCYAPREKASAIGVLKYSVVEIRFWIGTVLKSLKMLFTGGAGVRDLSGPVGVVSMISDTYEESEKEGALITWMSMLYMLILLSANVGVMNLLPLPALDGGRLLFLLAEAVIGHKVNQKVEGVITFAGVMALILLMVVVLYQDIMKLF